MCAITCNASRDSYSSSTPARLFGQRRIGKDSPAKLQRHPRVLRLLEALELLSSCKTRIADPPIRQVRSPTSSPFLGHYGNAEAC